MKGVARKEWIKYQRIIHWHSKGYYGEEIPDRTYHLYNFHTKAIGVATRETLLMKSWKLLKRAASCFFIGLFTAQRFNHRQEIWSAIALRMKRTFRFSPAEYSAWRDCKWAEAVGKSHARKTRAGQSSVYWHKRIFHDSRKSAEELVAPVWWMFQKLSTKIVVNTVWKN